MISDEAVEAAAYAIAQTNGDGWLFEPPIIDGVMRSSKKSMESYRRDARAALEAAAPYIAASAWDEGRESVDFDSCGLNPYRSQV